MHYEWMDIGLTFTTIFSATRGPLGVIGLSFAFFLLSLTISTAHQIVGNPRPAMTLIYRSSLRFALDWMVFGASLTNGGGIILMGTALAYLNTNMEVLVSGVTTTGGNVRNGGFLSLAPIVLFTIFSPVVFYFSADPTNCFRRRVKGGKKLKKDNV